MLTNKERVNSIIGIGSARNCSHSDITDDRFIEDDIVHVQFAIFSGGIFNFINDLDCAL